MKYLMFVIMFFGVSQLKAQHDMKKMEGMKMSKKADRQLTQKVVYTCPQ